MWIKPKPEVLPRSKELPNTGNNPKLEFEP